MDNVVRDALSRNIKMLRVINLKSQEEMAKMFNISRSCFSLYESGRRSPSIEFLYDLAKEYNLTIDSLFEEDERTFLFKYLGK